MSNRNHAWPWAGADDAATAEKIFKREFPALHRHFKQYEEIVDPNSGEKRGLRHREDQGRWWWELRSCAYYDAFEFPKTLYVDITWTPSFLVDKGGRFTNNTCYFVPTEKPGVALSLNAPVGWWYSWRKAQHGKDEALRYFTDFMSSYPIANIPVSRTGKLADLVDDASRDTVHVQSAQRSMLDWLKHEMGVEKPKGSLQEPAALDPDGFVGAVRASLPRRRELSGADIARLKAEHKEIVQPAREARARIVAVERRLSAIVNEAYGLTEEDLALMWKTAPPRMPFREQDR